MEMGDWDEGRERERDRAGDGDGEGVGREVVWVWACGFTLGDMGRWRGVLLPKGTRECWIGLAGSGVAVGIWAYFGFSTQRNITIACGSWMEPLLASAFRGVQSHAGAVIVLGRLTIVGIWLT